MRSINEFLRKQVFDLNFAFLLLFLIGVCVVFRVLTLGHRLIEDYLRREKTFKSSVVPLVLSFG
jgi:hypothetical protein